MIPTGDTKSHDVANWAHNQAAYIGGNHLLLLLVLAHAAFYRRDNPEQAPVGQVLHGFSGVHVLSAWTRISERSVYRLLWSLQAEHGYLTRVPRPSDQRPGRLARIIQLYWTAEDDAMRASHRAGRSALPDEFVVSAHQIEIRDRPASLRLLRGGQDEVEQL
jgi:hypothetical protein